MRHYTSVLTLVIFGAVSAYSQVALNPVPERALGTPELTVKSNTPNLVEGREFYAPETVALDTSVAPPILYVSDYVNNRVLAWKNSANFTNGQMADMVIGQQDLRTTFPQGPGASTSNYSTGLTRPSGLAVDKSGNLYVADAGNNRILRYPTPFAQTTSFPIPDLYIGQPNLSSHSANYPSGKANPQGIYLNNGSTTLLSNLTFDSAGNLWVVDTGNVRVLRFQASALAGGGGSLSADLVLGQPDLNTTLAALNGNDATVYPTKLSQFIAPICLAFDPNGNLFVGDSSRALVFAPPFSSGMAASSHVLGIFPTGYKFPTTATDLQALLDHTGISTPSAFFFLANDGSVGVVDAGYSRIAIFDPFSKWPTDGTPPSAKTILGQPNTCTQSVNQTCKAPNNGNPQASSNTFSGPSGAAYTGTELFLVDAGNSRILDLPQQGSTFGGATRVLGQDSFTSNAPNLIEGREFNFTGQVGSDAGIAVDPYSSVPHLYVADPYNNRVLGYKDARSFRNGGQKADIVLGQPDFATNVINYPSGDPNKPTKTNLFHPIGLVVDPQGNLYVADSQNGRVVRYPAPFAYTGTTPEPADLVLGQPNFTTRITDPAATIMGLPYGVALTPSCSPLLLPCPAPNGLVVSDALDNRVLYIPMTNGTFAAGTDNGKAATVVFGQTGFATVTTGSTLSSLNTPRHVSTDTDGFVYVADSGNNRMLIFPDPHGNGTAPTGQVAVGFVTGLSAPEGVYTNPITNEIWIANSAGQTMLRYADRTSVQLLLGSITGLIDASGGFVYKPLAIAQDQYGDLIVADDASRVTFYYPGINVCNGASFLPSSATTKDHPTATCLPDYESALITAGSTGLPTRYLAPGAFATIFPCVTCQPSQFTSTAGVFNGTYPVPTTLSDVQVLIDNVAAPLYYVGPAIPPDHPVGQINFVIPNGARSSGFADLQVVQVSTGRILGAAQLPMASVAPGAFLYPSPQKGASVYVAAINEDGTINGPNSPALRGHAISLYMTGQGAIVGGPPDGVPATTAISAQYPLTVLLNGFDVNGGQYGETTTQHVLYSGINQYPGMWQINVKIPNGVVVTSPVWLVVISNGNPSWDATVPFKTYIYVK